MRAHSAWTTQQIGGSGKEMAAASRRREDDLQYFARWLDVTMVNRDITGSQLAAEADVNESVVSRWRSGQARPSLESCEAIARFLGVEPLRFAVTAGAIPPSMAEGIEPLPLPPPTALRSRVIEQIEKVKGVSESAREAMVAAYEDVELGPASRD